MLAQLILLASLSDCNSIYLYIILSADLLIPFSINVTLHVFVGNTISADYIFLIKLHQMINLSTKVTLFPSK